MTQGVLGMLSRRGARGFAGPSARGVSIRGGRKAFVARCLRLGAPQGGPGSELAPRKGIDPVDNAKGA